MNQKPRILVVGSLAMDLIVTTERFPGSGETVLGASFQSAPGGKGANQAIQAARLGADVTMVGCVGSDAFGSLLLHSLQEAGVHTERLRIQESAPSAIANILLEREPSGNCKNRIIAIPGANMTLREKDVDFLRDEINRYDMVLLQLEIPLEINQLVARYAFAAGVPVMLNPAPAAPLPDDLLACLTYLCPNEHEAAAMTGLCLSGDDPADRESFVRAIGRKFQSKGVENVLITMGEAGAAMVDHRGCFHQCPAVQNVHAVDPTAAGDSFIGAFCTAMGIGIAEEAALAFANLTASITVSRLGAQPSLPTWEEVAAAVPAGSRLAAVVLRS